MLIERDDPLESLLNAARRGAAGHGSTIVLEGEAGTGKTSLLREFARRVGPGCRVLWGWCEALFTPRPLGPLQDMAEALDPRVAPSASAYRPCFSRNCSTSSYWPPSLA